MSREGCYNSKARAVGTQSAYCFRGLQKRKKKKKESKPASLRLDLFFNEFIDVNWRLITLQYCSGFHHISTRISHQCTRVPHLETLSHFPPHPIIPQGHPSAPALSTLSHASNLDWQSISHMLIYMFQCYSLKSSHPCLLYLD